MINVVIFASGEGSNAEKIIEHLGGKAGVRVTWILCNNENAGVIKRAEKHRKGVQLISKFVLENYCRQLIEFLQMEKTDLIVLAGFLLKIPNEIVEAFAGRIINLHPSLLPKFGGKGMYGIHVHRAVIASGEHESGITIHYVNHEYDKGEVLLQQSCLINENDTPELLSQKIQILEHKYFPEAVEKVAMKIALEKNTGGMSG